MKFSSIVFFVLLFIPFRVHADLHTPAQTPKSTGACEIITNAYQGSQPQIFGSVAEGNGYTMYSAHVLIGNNVPDGSDSTWQPQITLEAVQAALTTSWGLGRWEGHSGQDGLAVCMFAKTQAGFDAREAVWNSYLNNPSWADKIYKATNAPGSPAEFYSIGLKWGALKAFSAQGAKEAILEVTGCNTGQGGKWNGTSVTAVTTRTLDKWEEAENTDKFWGALDDRRKFKRWTGAAINEADLLVLASGSESNRQISPALTNWYSDEFFIPRGAEGRRFIWHFDGTVTPTVSPGWAVEVGWPAELIPHSSQFGVNSSGFTYFECYIRRIPNNNTGTATVTLHNSCVKSVNNEVNMREGNTFSVCLDDNAAASFVGGGVVNGTAWWNVDWVHNSDYWVVEVDSLGEWVTRATTPSDSHVNGRYEVEVGTGFSMFQIIEVDRNGQRRVYLRDQPTQTARIPPEDVKLTWEQLEQRYYEIVRRVSSRDDLVRTDTGLTAVVFCPSDHVSAWEYFKNYIENWSIYRMAVLIETIDDYPTNPEDFRVHLKSVMWSYASQGATLFQLSGRANWHEQFNDPSWWLDAWASIWSMYSSIGVVGFPELDDIPTWYIPTDNTTHPDNSFEYFYPFQTTDKLYIDFDGDGIPDPGYYIGRVPVQDPTDLFSYLLKIVDELSWGYQNDYYQVGVMVGDMHYLIPGDGQRALEKANQVVEAVPPGHSVSMFKQSDHPLTGPRNNAASYYFERKQVIAMIASESTRSSPGNNFNLTVSSNPFHMGMLAYQNNHPVVLAASCNTADLARPWRQSIGPCVMYRMLFTPWKGAGVWWGNSVGSFQEINGDVLTEITNRVLVNANILPTIVSIQDAEQQFYQAEPFSEVNKQLLGKNFYGWVGHFVVKGDVPTTVREAPDQIAVGNYPNPFNPIVTISYSLTRRSHVALSIYNLRGQRVRNLHKGENEAGHYKSVWDGRDDSDRSLASGVYVYRLETEDGVFASKITLAK